MAAKRFRSHLSYTLLLVLLLAGLGAMLFAGPVRLSPEEVMRAVLDPSDASVASVIVRRSRWPMALTAAVSGAMLAVSGLMMQTVFRNPLAGPSVLGVSTGASLGVAIVLLGANMFGTVFSQFGIVAGALAGAAVVILMLVAASARVHSNSLLLIIGLMVSYLGSSLISLLNFFAPSEGTKSFVVWGMGSLQTVTPQQLPWFAAVGILLSLVSLLCVKPLNALLLGETYARSLGYAVGKVRTLLLILSGVMTAIVAAYCGPIGFIGLVVPHMARLLLGTGNHALLIPATVLGGAVVMLICALLSVLPSRGGIIPINAITPVFGVPVILYIITRRNRL